jgi:hypothetical protein
VRNRHVIVAHPKLNALCWNVFNDTYIRPDDVEILIATIIRYTDDPLLIETCIYRCIQTMKWSPFLGDTCQTIREVLYG